MSDTEPEWTADLSSVTPGDVLRWTEAIWLSPNRNTGKTTVLKIGERRITAAVRKVHAKDIFRLTVIHDEITVDLCRTKIKRLEKDQTIVRKRSVIESIEVGRMKRPE